MLYYIILHYIILYYIILYYIILYYIILYYIIYFSSQVAHAVVQPERRAGQRGGDREGLQLYIYIYTHTYDVSLLVSHYWYR